MKDLIFNGKKYTVTDEYFDYLMCQQPKGKELKVVDGQVVAVDHEPTQEELIYKELSQLNQWFTQYDNQVKQYERCVRLGIEYDKDINELDNQARINQLRIAELRAELKSLQNTVNG